MISPPLRIIRKLVGTRAVSNGLAGIEPLVADALGLVQTFLLGMDWNSPGRDLGDESWLYRESLEAIAQIHGNEHTRHLITPTLVGTLTSMFSRLIGEDDWEHTASTEWDVWQCRDVLVQLRSTVGISSSS